MTQVKLVLQNKLNEVFVCVTKLVLSVQRIFKAGLYLFLNTAMNLDEHVSTCFHLSSQVHTTGLLACTVTIFKKLPNLSTVAVLYPIPIRTV